MWIKHRSSYINLENVISISVDRSRDSLRLVQMDGDEVFLSLPKDLSAGETHRRLKALLAPCEPFASPDPIRLVPGDREEQ
ncbi:hypothetical protein [Geothermobacter hydrogeniphilus]|uniref:Uncharacterized protein n=1 Tax=Geothermobacter hydrogeniphilus TaxID=1969733 RepID=A0A1X0XX99_9BACT|nr:hypothetical protein [Geothermobacter hydrogeniphilus]ORJ57502.1 hypothetical protein B5V00_13715 [Geothermobacter hydrogeniphilus]